jgi:hypothetical protein
VATDSTAADDAQLEQLKAAVDAHCPVPVLDMLRAVDVSLSLKRAQLVLYLTVTK